ncbi:MAG: PAS domain S-box protein [Pyrinomonadaceae bacterium]
MLRVIRSSSLLHYSMGLVAVCAALLFLWPGLLPNLFATDGFMTHYHCYAQRAPLVFMHYYSDWLIGLSYVAISLTLIYLVYRARRDIPFHWIFLAFGLFIIACGGTHFMEVYTTYHDPVYWLAGYVKLITAVASVATAIVLPPLVPKTLALVRTAKLSNQRRAQLETANEELSTRAAADATAIALGEINQTLQALIQASPLAIFVLDTDGHIKLWNPAAERIYGWRAQEVLGHTLPTIPVGREEELRRIHQAAVAGHNFVNYETRRVRKDGTLIDVSISTAPLRDAGGQTNGVVALVADITERRRAEAMSFQLAAIVESSDDAIISKDLTGTILSWNPAAERLYGYTAAEAIGQSVMILIPADRSDEETRFIEQIKRGERMEHYETVRVRKDGTHLDVSLTVSSVKDAAGRIVGASKIARDITERKRAEESLRQIEARNRALLNAIPDLLFRLDHAGRFLDVHAARPDDLLASPAEFIGQHLSDVLPADIAAEALRYIERATASGELQVFEYEFARDDETRNYEARVVASGADEVIVIVRDVTRRKRAEAMQHFLADATATLTSSLDYEPTLQRVAQFAVPHLADWCMVYMLDDVDKVRLLAIAHADETKAALAHEIEQQDAEAGGVVPKAIRTGQSELYPRLPEPQPDTTAQGIKRLDLARRLGIRSVMIVPLVARGRTLGALSFATAESGRIYGPADLALAEELARRAALAIDNARLYQRAQEANRAKDEFLATLSHELRTPLTPIIGWVHMINAGQVSESDGKRGLGVIDKNSQALARLINDLLDMSAILNGKMRIDHLPVTIDNVVQEAVETVRPEAAQRGIELELAPCAASAGLVAVSGDRTRLGQVCWNLISNAVKFSNEGGRVRVACVADDAEVRITVADEGIGIAPEFLPYVFERFRQADMSTTKLHGGLGIGLALVKSFVEAHGGTVEVKSAGVGQGSRFTVRLPRLLLGVPPSGGLPTRQPLEDRTPNDSPRLLLIEDAADTLELLRRAFTARGYRVTACAAAEEAQQVAAREQFDIIISDIGLPHIDGYELLERLRREQPALRTVPAIALTGYATAQDVARARAAGFAVHVAKPTDPATLIRVVEQLLAQ